MAVTTVLVKNKQHAGGTRSGQWAVVVGRTERSTHRRKDTAIRQARQAARGAAPSVLKVQNIRGQWSTEASYS